MALSEITLAELSRRQLCDFFAGKWHLGPNEAFTSPEHQGFDVNRELEAGAPFKEESILPHMPIRVWKTVLLANISLSALLLKPSTSWKPKAKTFHLMCHFTRCTPLMAPAALVAKYRRKPGNLVWIVEVFQPEEQV